MQLLWDEGDDENMLLDELIFLFDDDEDKDECARGFEAHCLGRKKKCGGGKPTQIY